MTDDDPPAVTGVDRLAACEAPTEELAAGENGRDAGDSRVAGVRSGRAPMGNRGGRGAGALLGRTGGFLRRSSVALGVFWVVAGARGSSGWSVVDFVGGRGMAICGSEGRADCVRFTPEGGGASDAGLAAVRFSFSPLSPVPARAVSATSTADPGTPAAPPC